MKKKLLALLLALTMTLSLAACGGKDAPAPQEPDQGVEDVVDETTTDDVDGTTDEPAEGEIDEAAETNPEEPALVPDGKPAEKPAQEPNKPVEKPAQEPNKPVEKPAEPKPPVEKPAEPKPPVEKPAVDESQSKPAGKTDLTAFYEAQTADGAWPAMMPLDGEMLDAFYAGLSDITVNQCAVYTAVITAAVGEVALVEVENAADVQAVKDIFQARVNYQVGDETNPGGAWYPGSIEGWKTNSRIVSNGNFVMLVVHDGADAVVDAFNALFA